jgi:hypothetical protein
LILGDLRGAEAPLYHGFWATYAALKRRSTTVQQALVSFFRSPLESAQDSRIEGLLDRKAKARTK